MYRKIRVHSVEAINEKLDVGTARSMVNNAIRGLGNLLQEPPGRLAGTSLVDYEERARTPVRDGVPSEHEPVVTSLWFDRAHRETDRRQL